MLDISKFLSGNGENQVKFNFELLEDWDIIITEPGVCGYTTASNTCRINGAYVLLEQLIMCYLYYLLCPHYILKFILRSVLDLKFTFLTICSDVPIFKQFQ